MRAVCGLFFFLSQGDKCRLSGKLQRHQKDSEKVQVHGRNTLLYQFWFAAERPDEKMREEKDERPHNKSKYNRKYSGQFDGGFHASTHSAEIPCEIMVARAAPRTPI